MCVAAAAVAVTQDRLLREVAGRGGEKRKRGSGPLLPWPKFNEPVHQAASREEQTKPEPACEPFTEPIHQTQAEPCWAACTLPAQGPLNPFLFLFLV